MQDSRRDRQEPLTATSISNVYLGLGSNIGDRTGNLKQALSELAPHLDFIAVSSLYETEPVGFTTQPSFLNLVCHATTSLSPWELLQLTKGIEARMGRLPTFRNGPRIIDIDILLFDDLQLSDDSLTIPHQGLPHRQFVLAPLVEIASDLIHPATKKTILEMARECPDHHWVRRINGGDCVSAIC